MKTKTNDTTNEARLNLPALERRVQEQWRERRVFERSVAQRADAEPWTFFEGPPTANGQPGVHHALTRSFKDLYVRFKTMQGYYVERRGGWDCHGLPVELEVEKELGLTNKEQVRAYGVDRFNARCRESVEHYVEQWTELTERLGFWLDTENAYWTMSPRYVESVWWSLKKVWDQGLLYRGTNVVPHCSRCQTTLSSHELSQGYRERDDLAVYLALPLDDSDLELVVWTTTPWTLPANQAVACNADLTYSVVDVEGRRLVVSSKQTSKLFPQASALDELSASTLLGRRYSLPFANGQGTVVAASFVSDEEGTGLVHLAPAHGSEDAKVGEREGLASATPVGLDGCYSELQGFEGRDVLDAQPDLLDDLEKRGYWLRREMVRHRYPHCWRCSTPLLNMSKTAWYAATSSRRGRMVDLNESVSWHPEHAGAGRFADWLANNVDWALSRERFWGTPLPFWLCKEGHQVCVGSLAQLRELSGKELSDPHRPFVDDVSFTCTEPGCEHEMHRTPEVLDVWWDSGSMPFAQAGEGAEPAQPPVADFVCEGLDQTRGWFYALHAVSTLLYDRAPFSNVLCLGLVLDSEGKKMSKSQGNAVDLSELLDELGADLLRYYYLTSKAPWEGYRFSAEEVREQGRALETLSASLRFLELYSPVAGAECDESGELLDAWLLSRLQATVTGVSESLERFDSFGAGHALQSFVEDLSNWYLRHSRRRFWRGEEAAFETLRHCLLTVSRLLAPFCPHFAEFLHQRLDGGGDSVHLLDYPQPDASLRDPDLEHEMRQCQKATALAAALRAQAKLPLRQPLRGASVLGVGDRFAALLCQAMNVKELHFGEAKTMLRAKPNFARLGPKLGARVKLLAEVLAGASQEELELLDAGEALRVELEGRWFVLGTDDVELRREAVGGHSLLTEGGVTVSLDLTLDQELRQEGLYRQALRSLQELRREQGFEVDDHVAVCLSADAETLQALKMFRAELCSELLASGLELEARSSGPGAVELGSGHWLEAKLRLSDKGRVCHDQGQRGGRAADPAAR